MAGLWMIQAMATAAQGCGHADGEAHAMMVFVAAADRDVAVDHALTSLVENGWRDPKPIRSGEISSEVADDDDPILSGAMKDAVANGCSIVIYSDPITTGPAMPREAKPRRAAGRRRNRGTSPPLRPRSG